MNTSQLMAWLICLALAFFAAALAVSNGYKVALLQRKFAAVNEVAEEQRALLEGIEAVLRQIEEGLRSEPRSRMDALDQRMEQIVSYVSTGSSAE